ncbi:MAG: tetratricopeptide repeat protein [Sedimentisphaerales bacterium]|nr:tetratricopeptide repeat protein [Sedimentisphaerales bacterium]
MPKRYFNWKLAIVLIISIFALGITAYGLRQWQRVNRADRGLILGNKAYAQQDWSEAAKQLGRYLSVEQNDVSVLMKYADSLLKIRPSRRNNVSQALNAYRIVLRAEKNNKDACTRLTEIYLSMGMPSEAELIVSNYIKNNSKPEPKLRRMLALAMAGQRKFSEATAQLKLIIQEHPDDILAYEALGQLAENRPDDVTDSPERWFNEAVKINPTSALAYTVRAGFYKRSKEIPKALADLEIAEKQDLADPNVELRLASEFIDSEISDKAEQHLKSVQKTIPEDIALWIIWAKHAVKSKSQEKMLEVAETGLKNLSSQYWDFMPTATELFIRSGRFDRADECITQMNQKDVAPKEVSFLEGLLAAERGQLLEAVNHWRKSMGLGNTSPEIRLALSSTLLRLGNTQSALKHLRTLVSERPNNVAGYIALARLFAQVQNWAESSRNAAAAMQLSPNNTEASMIYLQAQMQLQAVAPTDESNQVLRDVQKKLSDLYSGANELLEYKLLRFQLALQQKNFTDAQTFVTQLREYYPSHIKTAMAEAELLVVQNKTDEAVSTLLKTIENFPQVVEPVRYLAILLERQGGNEKCEEIIKEAIERINVTVAKRTLGLLLAEFYLKWNQKENVYMFLDTLVRKLPEDIPLKRRLLLCEQIIKDNEKAQKLVDDIKSLEGQEGWQWRYEQAKIWYLSSDFKTRYMQIVLLLQENLQTNPNDQESRMLLAAAYNRSGELQLAISTYREALNLSPNDLRIIIPFIDVLSQSMEFEEVDRILRQTSHLKLYHPKLQQFQLQSHLRHGQLNMASDILQDFISHDPNNQVSRFSLAILNIQQNKFEEAEDLLNQLKIQEPNSLKIAAAQVQLNFRQNRTTEALRICDEMVNNLKSASAYIFRARTNTSLKRIDEATKDFERAVALEPKNIEIWMLKSEFYRSIGRLDKAITDIQNALSLDSGDIRIQKQAISLFLKSSDAKDILKGKSILEQAVKSHPDDIDLLLFKVVSLLGEGTSPAINNAEQILRKMTDEKPQINKAWEFLGEILLRKGQAGRAIDAALRGLTYTPNDKALLMLKARAEEARSPILAISTLKTLREVDPNNTDTTLYLANIHIKIGEPDKAIKLLEAQLVSRAGTSEIRTIRIARAIALYKNGQQSEAQIEFDSLLQSEPDDPAPLFAQVRLLRDERLWTQLNQKVMEWSRNHPEDSRTPIIIATNLVVTNDNQAKKTAEDIYRMVLKNKPDSIEVLTNLAVLLQTSGRPNESVPLYQQVLQLQPDNHIVINNLAWLMCEDKGRYKEALELAQRGLKLFPNYIDLIDTRGVIYYKMGQFDKAAEDFSLCVELYPPGAPAAVASRFRLAKTLAKLGQNVKALEHLNQVRDLQNQIGGLSNAEMAEVQSLFRKLQEGS